MSVELQVVYLVKNVVTTAMMMVQWCLMSREKRLIDRYVCSQRFQCRVLRWFVAIELRGTVHTARGARYA